VARKGDTFFLRGQGVNKHLFVIISDPNKNPDEIVTVNFTSWAPDKDQSCTIEAGAHALITKKSCVRYRQDRAFTAAKFDELAAKGFISVQTPVGDNLLKDILAGARRSDYIPLRNLQILIQQGLVEDR
jgi:hypothetical protein